MKNFIFTFLIAFTAITANAQLTITDENHNFNSGGYFEQNILPSPAGITNNGGAGVTWDFSGLTPEYTGNVDIQESTSATYPNANIFYAQSGTYTYFGTNNNALTYYGFSSSAADVVLTDGEEQVRFPMTYGDSYTDDFAGTITGFGNTFDREGTVDVEADGYGTLITPAATYDNALRIRIVRNTTDLLGGTVSGTSTDTIYYWFAGDINFTVMTYFKSYDEEGALVSSSINYVGSGVNIEDQTQTGEAIYPNPANKYINLTDYNAEIKKIQISGISGKVWKQIAFGKKRISIAKLPKGIYIVEVFYSNKPNAAYRFIKE